MFIGKGHRRANTASLPIEIIQNKQQNKPNTLNLQIANATNNSNTNNNDLNSPLSEDEFFDAIDELTASFDQAEENIRHNEEIKKQHNNNNTDSNNTMTDKQEVSYSSSHRYSDKVNAHIEKHSKSLDNSHDDDDGWIEFHSEGKMRMFRRDEATPDGRIIDPLRLFHTIDKVSAYECQHYRKSNISKKIHL